jgi:L-alanine-DL-glutamate epimerase-like enolase superfamily enzyme
VGSFPGIRSIECWTICLPLTRPVVFGDLVYRTRDYSVLRLRDDDGVEGVGWGMTRGAPLTETVHAMAPLVDGADPEMSEQIWRRLYQASIPYGQRGISMRALSLFDIALWDMRSRRLGLPLWRLFGGARESLPVSVGGGYFREQREAADVAEELRGYVDAGFRHVKIPGGGWEAERERDWVSRARDAVGPEIELAVDAHWTWEDIEDARRVLNTWEDARLAWVEDPLWPEAVGAHATLRRVTRTPLAVGDEQSGRWAYENLLRAEAADIWRVDVTTVGGFTEARRIAAMAGAAGIPVSVHVYPELHVHLAASEPGVLAVEYTEPAQEIDLCHRFLDRPAAPRDGRLDVPTGPGLGVEIDWELVSAGP